jgi:hypothetical protein
MEEDSTANALQTETWREDGLTSHPKTASEGRRGASPFKRLPENRQEKRRIRNAGLLHVYIYMYY